MFSSFTRLSGRQRRQIKASQTRSPARDQSLTSIASRSVHRSRQRSNVSYGEEDAVTEEDEEHEDHFEDDEDADVDEDADADADADEDADDNTPLLPIFSTLLDAIPVFTMTHAIRELVVARCDTTLSWDQLRSPQVSQFLLKPIHQEIRTHHFNAGTQYALISNCLQFSKEADLFPGYSGTSKTRALLCELLAIRLLKEYSTRTLIDALSYDFDPLQGQPEPAPATANEAGLRQSIRWKTQHRAARVSCFEVALRSQAKRFLAHPIVVRQLEAIWAGTIVFYTAADSMHRKAPKLFQHASYGATETRSSAKAAMQQDMNVHVRRSVTIYNPRDASLFKLSRLRVPRYRNILSTLSFAVLLGLFLAVLIRRSIDITSLEVFFWFWAAGYMLDEIVGFNEQGFSLYIASFWNTFDLGILLLLFVHLCLRIYGIMMPDARKQLVANMAYDVLAADAILLFPRLFSVLDHYKYFSQLLIAFRMMAQDLMAVFLLILVSFSGFFVALTLSFGSDGSDTPSTVAYALMQMLLGFTPAAWDRWDGYNPLGKFILTLFLVISHFVVVTILITVLSNSFMAIVQNANEEHQFVFAVNTISAVKSDALFSYVAPTNVIQWLLTPLRSFVPFRQYVYINRTIIKITHFPILFTIYAYERTILGSSVCDSIDVVEIRDGPKRPYGPKMARLRREPSIATVRQDRALEEVFRRPADTLRGTQPIQARRKTSTVVNNWMQTLGEEVESPPTEQDRRVVDKASSRFQPARRGRNFSRAISVASDPEEFVSRGDFLSPPRDMAPAESKSPFHFELPSQQTDGDGDDELPTDDNDEDLKSTEQASQEPEATTVKPANVKLASYFRRKGTSPVQNPDMATPKDSLRPLRTSGRAPGVDTLRSLAKNQQHHMRNASSATMIYKPTDSGNEQSDKKPSSPVSKDSAKAQRSGTISPVNRPGSSGAGRRSPKRHPHRSRPILPARDGPAKSASHVAGLIGMIPPRRPERHQPSLGMDLVSDIGDNNAIGGGYVGAIPASFALQMYQAGENRQLQQTEEQERFSRLLMARMNSLEEGFRSVIHEVRETRETMGSSAARSRAESSERMPKLVQREKKNQRQQHPPTGDKENVGPVQATSSTVVAAQPTQVELENGTAPGRDSADASA
ncbi:hypothetical protein DV736_g3313, partial [Chaetothyriales sp. CBS 134916]